MIFGVGFALQMSSPSPLTRRRDFGAFLRGPVGAVTDRFGTRDEYRLSQQHVRAIAPYPEPSDAAVDQAFGIQGSGEVTVKLAGLAPGDEDGISARLFTLLTTWRNTQVDLDLVNRVYREDGSSVEFVNERRSVVKTISKKKNVLELGLADVDRSALETLIPFKTYTTLDWPELFIDHVNRPVPQGVGTIVKVPLTYVVKSGGTFKYSACEVLPYGTPQVLAVYRENRVISSSEYTTSTMNALVSGTTNLIVNFTVEQVDFNGKLYELTVDLLCPGPRFPADETKRILQLIGLTADASTFAAASLHHNTVGIQGDYGYVGQKQASAILEKIQQLGRAELRLTQTGSCAIFVDAPREVKLCLDDQSDEIDVEAFTTPDLTKSIVLQYRPSTSQDDGKLTGRLARTTTGVAGETVFQNPYLRDHDVADKHASYLFKREKNRGLATGSVHGVQLARGDLVAIQSSLSWTGTKIFAAPQIARPADRNTVGFVEYLEDTYVYTAGALPADATNVYTPDYSQTPPAAPTALTVVSQGTSSDTDGKVTAYALIRATPPAVNWARLMVQVTDTTTNEVYQAQLKLNAGNYEITVGGLRPNRAHEVRAWAVNGSNLDGSVTAAVPFTSANATTALAAPSVAVSQKQSFEVQIDLGLVSNVAGQPGFYRNVLFEKVGAGAFTEVNRSAERVITRQVVHGTSYQYKARSEDMNHNESADSSPNSITPSTVIDDSYVVGQGISGVSIADNSINRGRGYTGTGSASGSISASSSVGIGMDLFTFSPNVYSSLGSTMIAQTAYSADDTGFFGLLAGPGGDSYTIRWRNFLT